MPLNPTMLLDLCFRNTSWELTITSKLFDAEGWELLSIKVSSVHLSIKMPSEQLTPTD